MRIATWNINSLRARIDRVEAFLARHSIDVLALQETKGRPEQLPLDRLEAAGYEVVAHGLDQWNGVAIASRVGLSDVQCEFADAPEWQGVVEARALGATCNGVRIWSLYIPNGRTVDDPHYAYKLAWLDALHRQAKKWLTQPTILAGDWNIIPQDDDVWDITAFAGKTHASPPERAAFTQFLASGYVDLTRRYTPGPQAFTYWDYFQRRFERNHGMRIDFLLGSPAVADRTIGGLIDTPERDPAAGPTAVKPSDHAPVIVELAA